MLTRTQRETIIADADNRCQQCGAIRNGYGAIDRYGKWHEEDSIHHMNSDVGYDLFGTYNWVSHHTVLYVSQPTPENYTVLCSTCHSKEYPGLYSARAQKAVNTKRYKKRKKYETATGQMQMFDDVLGE